MTPMRVLQVATSVSPRHGGPTTVTLARFSTLRNSGMDVRLIATDIDLAGRLPPDEAEELARGGVELSRVLLPRARAAVSVGLVFQLIRAIRWADVVHVHSVHTFPSVVASLLAMRAGKPFIIEPHGALSERDYVRRTRMKNLLDLLVTGPAIRRCRAVLFSSKIERDSAVLFEARDRGRVIPHGADFGVRYTDRRWAERKPKALWIGRIAPVKNLQTLLQAWPLIRNELPTAELVLAGPDTSGLRFQLESKARRLGVGASVSFVGPVDASARQLLLAESRVLVLPSVSENFGLAAAEALFAGMPVVVTEGVGIAEAVAHAGAGRVVPVGSAKRLADAVTDLLGDGHAWTTASEAALQLAHSDFTWSAANDKLVVLYRESVRRS